MPAATSTSKRVLVLSRHFPPEVTGGSRRPSVFTGELRSRGHQVAVLSGGGDASARFTPLSVSLRELFATVRLGRLYRTLVRGLLFPDEGVVDIGPILAAAPSGPFDLVLAMGPPSSLLVAGAVLARRYGCRWIADLSDPWSGHPLCVAPTALHRRSQELLERRTLGTAWLALTASYSVADAIRSALGPDQRTEVLPVLNAYDPRLFQDRLLDAPASGPITVGFYGSFYGPIDPEPLVRAVARAGAELEFAGRDLDGKLAHAVARHAVSFRPLGELSNEAVAKRMMQAHVLSVVLPADRAWAYCQPQKVAEYIGAGRPILAHVPEGETAELVRRYDAGRVVSHEDVDAGARAIAELAPRPRRLDPPDALTWHAQLAPLLDRIARPGAPPCL